MVLRCYIAEHVDMTIYRAQNYWPHAMHKNYRREDEIEIVRRKSAVGIMTRHGVERARVRIPVALNFRGATRLAPRKTQPPVLYIQVLFVGGKVTGAWR